MILKSHRLFYVPEWHPDPVNALAAGLWYRDTRFLDAVRVEGAGKPAVLEFEPRRMVVRQGQVVITFVLGDSLKLVVDVEAGEAGLVLTADFRDLFELRGWTAASRGEVLPPEIGDPTELVYRARDGHMLSTSIAASPALRHRRVPNGVVLLIPEPGRYSVEITPEPGAPSRRRPARPAPASVTTSSLALNRLLARSADDLATLETAFPDGTLPAAGAPWYVAPFGRDALMAAWQTLHLDPQAAAATLRTLAALQGRATDPDTGEQPGKIIHEARYGELARLGEIAQRPYYGSVDATSLFLMVAAETIAWGGVAGLADELSPAIDAALGWVTDEGDPDQDGLVEYPLPGVEVTPLLTARHQAWKDSDDSLHLPDGSEPQGPIAPVEAQAYTYRALRSLLDLTRGRGDVESAARLNEGTGELARRVNEAFWLENDGWYAQALDGDKRPVASIASNGAQLLFSGMVPSARSERMVARLFQPDLWSGWGVRTLGAGMPFYDPLSYHNGSVWPHDNGIIADGCYRTGHTRAGEAIFRAMLSLADSSPDGSMAELYSGVSTDSPPVQVPGSCRPQAWAAGTLPQILRSCLGLRPSGDVLVVAPALPSFLNRVEIEGMRALGSTGDLLVERDGRGYRVESVGLPVVSETP